MTFLQFHFNLYCYCGLLIKTYDITTLSYSYSSLCLASMIIILYIVIFESHSSFPFANAFFTLTDNN